MTRNLKDLGTNERGHPKKSMVWHSKNEAIYSLHLLTIIKKQLHFLSIHCNIVNEMINYLTINTLCCTYYLLWFKHHGFGFGYSGKQNWEVMILPFESICTSTCIKVMNKDIMNYVLYFKKVLCFSYLETLQSFILRYEMSDMCLIFNDLIQYNDL